MSSETGSNKGIGVLIVAALGVVFGDIGTSPLYAINQVFFGHSNLPISPDNVLGVISLVFWVLTLIITIKYVVFVLSADNNGEGGVFALFGLLSGVKSRAAIIAGTALILSAGLLFADGLITPSISVLAAVEGLRLATTAFDPYIVPITIAILTLLFAFQKNGTAKIGRIFGVVVAVWFLVIAALGLAQIMAHPKILETLNPLNAIKFLWHVDWKHLFLILGAVMLAVTGGEALYADLGHFGKRPIRWGWLFLVYPALSLNYLGQGAFLLGGGAVYKNNIFYSTVPESCIYPMVALATFATIIASQALITGAFSLVSQAMALGLFPRLKITHTNTSQEHQIYVPAVNWILYVGAALLVLQFRSSDNLAAAYGFAVAGVMFATSLAMIIVSLNVWGWPIGRSILIFGSFTFIDFVFLVANSVKFIDGAYVPVLVGAILFFVMSAYRWGRQLIASAYVGYKGQKPLSSLLDIKKRLAESGGVIDVDGERVVELDRSIVFMVSKAVKGLESPIPVTLYTYFERKGGLPKHLTILTIEQTRVPYILGDRYKILEFGSNVVSITARYGFMELPNVQAVLKDANERTLNDLIHCDIEFGEEEVVFKENSRSWRSELQLKIFKFLLKLATPVYRYFGINDYPAISKTIVPVVIENGTARIEMPELEVRVKSPVTGYGSQDKLAPPNVTAK